jgi:hypothetical protein
MDKTMSKAMWTRQQYMNKECTHQEYYLPIAQECGISLVESLIAFKILHSTDPHFNDIPLKEWDAYALCNQSCFQRACKKRGDQYSLASGVFILKAIAQHEKEMGLYEHWRTKPNPYRKDISKEE